MKQTDTSNITAGTQFISTDILNEPNYTVSALSITPDIVNKASLTLNFTGTVGTDSSLNRSLSIPSIDNLQSRGHTFNFNGYDCSVELRNITGKVSTDLLKTDHSITILGNKSHGSIIISTMPSENNNDTINIIDDNSIYPILIFNHKYNF
jgi:hypothetical protein